MRSYIHVIMFLLMGACVAFAVDALNSEQYTRVVPANDSLAVQYSPSNGIPIYYVMLSNKFAANAGPAAQLDVYVSDGFILGTKVTAPSGSVVANTGLIVPAFATTYVRGMSTMSRGITNITMETLVDEDTIEADACKFRIYTEDGSTLLNYLVVAQIYKKVNTTSDQVGQLLIADEILVTEYDDDVFILSVPLATAATKTIIRATLYRIP